MPIAKDLQEYFRTMGTRSVAVDMANNIPVTPFGIYRFIDTVGIMDTSAQVQPAMGGITVTSPAGIDRIRAWITAGFVEDTAMWFQSIEVNEIALPGDTINSIGQNPSSNGVFYDLQQNVVDQWCAKNNRPVPQ